MVIVRARCAVVFFVASTSLSHFGDAFRLSSVGDTLNSEDLETSELEQEAAQVGAQLMVAADAFLATEVSAGEKAQLRQTATISLLEKHGISMEEQFRVFFLTRAHMFGLTGVYRSADVEKKQQVFLEAEEGLSPPKMVQGTAVETKHDGDNSTATNLNSSRAPFECPFVERLSFAANASRDLGCTESPAFLANVSKLYADAFREAEKHSDDFFNETAINPNVGNSEEVALDIASYKALNKIIMFEKGLPDFARPLSTVDREVYMEWKKRQAGDVNAWFVNLRDKIERGESLADAGNLKDLYKAIVVLENRLSDIDAKITAASKQKWGEVKQWGFRSAMKQAKLWFKKKAQQFAHHVKKKAKAVWYWFKRQYNQAETECSRGMQDMVKSTASDNGVSSRQRLLKSAELSPEEQKRFMTHQVNAVRKSMAVVRNKTTLNATQRWRQTQVKINMLKVGFTDMQSDAMKGYVDPQKMNVSEERLREIESEACKEKQGGVSEMLSSVAHRLGKLLGMSDEERKQKEKRNPKQWLLPALGMRGAAVQASWKAWGIEEVVDFRNREIGYFTHGSGQIGTSLASVSSSGYLAFGHHGYKANWSLEESYQTSLYTAYSPGVGWFGLKPSVGLTFAIDSDNSAGTPWAPDPTGLNGVALGWSLSATPEALALPIQWGVDIGQILYKFHTSECFSSKSAFLLGILSKTCGTCYGGMEHASMSALRAGCWAAAFPLVSDAVFYIMWAITEALREPEWQQHCSPRSTKMRDDPANLATMIGQKIEEAVATLNRIEEESEQLVDLISDALESNEDTNIQHSYEIRQVKDVTETSCMNKPLELELAPPREAKPLYMQPKDHIKKTLSVMSDSKLREACLELRLKGIKVDCKQRLFNSRSTIEKKIRYILGAANVLNPFGKCTSDSDCLIQDSVCVSSGKGAWHRGDCRCKPGTCYEAVGGKDKCTQKPPILTNETISKGVKVWIKQHKIELGSFADQLQVLIDPNHRKEEREALTRAASSRNTMSF